MTDDTTRFGEATPKNFNKEVVSESGGTRIPGLGWELSADAHSRMEKIERMLRTADQRSGKIVLD